MATRLASDQHKPLELSGVHESFDPLLGEDVKISEKWSWRTQPWRTQL